MPELLSASVEGCSDARIYDSGFIVYLTVPRGCQAAAAPKATLAYRIGVQTQTVTVAPADFGTPVPLKLSADWTRTVSIHRRGSWRSFPNDGTWPWRDGAGLLVKDGGLYLLGGWSSDTGGKSDVWFTHDLTDWQQLVANAPWAGRHGSGWVVHRNRLWVIGGDLIDDVWSSGDGINWTQEAAQAPFGKRYTPNGISTGDTLFLYAGLYWTPYDWCAFQPECAVVGLNDVWRSDDGRAWSEVTPHAAWAGRGLVHGGVYFNGRIYVIGGGLKLALPGLALSETMQQFSDIWSSRDGMTWRLEANQLGFAPRTHFAALATPHGCYVANGSEGTQQALTGEMFFAVDCVHFAPVVDASPLPPAHATSMAWFNGSVVIMGGHRDTAGTRIWQYFPDS